jgi:hypothetical protein
MKTPSAMSALDHRVRAERLLESAESRLGVLEGQSMDHRDLTVQLLAAQAMLTQAHVHATLAMAKR